MRLHTLLHSLNINVLTAQEFIYSQTGEFLGEINSKITKAAVELLANEFGYDKELKKEISKIVKERKAISRNRKEAVRLDIETVKNGGLTKSHPILKEYYEKMRIIRFRNNEYWSSNPELKATIESLCKRIIKISKDNRLPIDYLKILRKENVQLHHDYKVLQTNFEIDHVGKSKKSSYYETEQTYERDEYEGFSWGGLSGEEAYTAMWNCD